MTPFKRPMKAVSLLSPDTETTDENILAGLEKLDWTKPRLVSIKKDGIRAVRVAFGGVPSLLSYTLKPIQNRRIQAHGSFYLPSGMDMELYNPSLSFQDISSRVMSHEHDDWAAIQYHAIDWINFTLGYQKRCDMLMDWKTAGGHIEFEYPRKVYNPLELMELFLRSEENGEEGICFRTPDSPYKQGRSTLKEEYLIKLCRWVRFEARITGFEEQMMNGNATSRNAIGFVDRSTSAAGLVGKGTLGALWVIDDAGREWKVGTGVGLDDRLRQHIWDNKTQYIGSRITVKYKPHGEKDKPRHPIFCGFREKGY